MSDPENPTCSCGHVFDEHDDRGQVCTVPDCRCVYFEEMVDDDDGSDLL
jgi:hypothetical protein